MTLLEACKALLPFVEGLEGEAYSAEHRQEIEKVLDNFREAVAEAEKESNQ